MNKQERKRCTDKGGENDRNEKDKDREILNNTGRGWIEKVKEISKLKRSERYSERARERERKRETEKERKRERERERERERQRQRPETERDRERDRETERQRQRNCYVFCMT